MTKRARPSPAGIADAAQRSTPLSSRRLLALGARPGRRWLAIAFSLEGCVVNNPGPKRS
jgi:hypothetical protein